MSVALSLLAFYHSFVFTITIIERIPSAMPHYQVSLFWTYKAIAAGRNDLKAEIFWNIVLFIPIGILIMILLSKRFRWMGIVIGFLLSAGIEVCQLVLCRGLFEFDDMIHNTLGTCIGVLVYLLACCVSKKISSR